MPAGIIRIEEGLTNIAKGLEAEPRWTIFECLFRENVLEHCWKIAFFVQLVIYYIRKYDPEIRFDAYRVLALAVIHDIGEVSLGDKPSPFKDKNDEQAERANFIRLVSCFPEAFQQYLTELYDIQHGNSIERKIFKVAELLERMMFCLREVRSGNQVFLRPLRENNMDIQIFVKEFRGIEMLYRDLTNLTLEEILEEG